MGDRDDNVIEMFDPEPEPERPTLEDYYKHENKALTSLNKTLKWAVIGLMFVLLGFNLWVVPWIVRNGEADLVAREQAACEARVEEETATTYSQVCSGEQRCPSTPELP